MAKDKESTDTYVIPPNFIEGGTFFGGLLKVRNTIEAGIIAVAVSLPVFQLPLDLQMKLIILCVTAPPLTILTLIGVMGESLSSFLLHFCWMDQNLNIRSWQQKSSVCISFSAC